MGKIIIVCLCAALLLVLPFNSLAVLPRPLVPENRIGVHTPDNGDPDGPTEGFLDDPTDWKYLGKAYLYIFLTGTDIFAVTAIAILENLSIDPDDIYNFYDYLMNLTGDQQVGLITIFLLLFSIAYHDLVLYACLFEAFDIRDLDGDGC